jgi:hypothetical protein
VDETYVKVCGNWRYLYRAIDQFGQVVDVRLSTKRDAGAARRFFMKAMASTDTEPTEVVTDRTQAYLGILDELLPAAFHDVEQYANKRPGGRPRQTQVSPATDARAQDRGERAPRCLRLCLRTEPSARPLRACGRAPPKLRLAQAFAELAAAI